MDLILEAKGHNGQIDLFEKRIDIKRKGFKAFMCHGFDGTKSIFLKSISAIQFKNAGAITNGYIQFVFSGSKENKDGIIDATKDENTVMFTSDQQSDFEKIRDYIFERL